MDQYQKLLLQEYKLPFHRASGDQAIPQPILSKHEKHNVTCGDHCKITISGTEEEISGYFSGEMCSVAVASSSILMKKIEGLSNTEAKEVVKRFIENIETDLSALSDDKEYLALYSFKDYQTRLNCVLLPWKSILEQ